MTMTRTDGQGSKEEKADMKKTTFTCDRCGGNADYRHCNGDPLCAEAYVSIGLYGAGDPSRAPRKDLCRDCHDGLEKWMLSPRGEPPHSS